MYQLYFDNVQFVFHFFILCSQNSKSLSYFPFCLCCRINTVPSFLLQTHFIEDSLNGKFPTHVLMFQTTIILINTRYNNKFECGI